MGARRLWTGFAIVALIVVVITLPRSLSNRDDFAGYAAADVVESIAERDQSAVSAAFGREISAGEMSELSSIVPPELADPRTRNMRVIKGLSWLDAKIATASVSSIDEQVGLSVEVQMAWDPTRQNWSVTNVRRAR